MYYFNIALSIAIAMLPMGIIILMQRIDGKIL